MNRMAQTVRYFTPIPDRAVGDRQGKLGLVSSTTCSPIRSTSARSDIGTSCTMASITRSLRTKSSLPFRVGWPNQAPRERGLPVQRDTHLLNGLLFDETGDRLSPIHASKAGKRYRYYISSRLKKGQSDGTGGWRLPAKEIERIVVWQLKNLLSDTARLSGWLLEVTDTAGLEVALRNARQVVDQLANPTSTLRLREIIHLALQRIEVFSDRLRLVVDKGVVVTLLTEAAPPEASGRRHPRHSSR